MQGTTFFDEKFNINATAVYDISVQLGLNGYAYCIFDTANNKHVALKHQPFENTIDSSQLHNTLQEYFKKDAFLNRKYNALYVAFQSRKQTLVPQTFFDPKYLKSYLDFNFAVDEYEEVHFDKLPQIQAYNTYSIPSAVTNTLTSRFTNKISYSHHTSPFLWKAFKDAENGSNVSVLVHRNFFDMSLITDGKLIFSNSFPFRDDHDFVYYLLYAIKQLKLKQQAVNLSISGNISSKGSKITMLKRYLRNIKTTDGNPEWFVGKIFDSIEVHRFMNLLSIRECALSEVSTGAEE